MFIKRENLNRFFWVHQTKFPESTRTPGKNSGESSHAVATLLVTGKFWRESRKLLKATLVISGNSSLNVVVACNDMHRTLSSSRMPSASAFVV